MKEYHLKRLNDQLRALSIVLVMPLLFGVLAIYVAWDHPSFWGKAGLILVVISLLCMIISYFNIFKSHILKIDDNALTISNKKGTKEKKYNINDIALIQYNKSANLIDSFFSKNQYNENILIFSKTGKGIFVCTNGNNPEFNQFFSDIRNRINAKEKLIYGKKLIQTMGVTYRYLYINPLYENSKVVKKKTRESGFYFGLKILLLIVIPFMIIINLWSIFSTPAHQKPPKNFEYKDISFQHEYYWKTKKSEITKGKTYYIGCKHNEYIIAITVSKDINEETPQEYIEYYLEDIEETELECEIGEIETGKFGDYDCVLAHYSYHVEGIEFFAAIYAFNTNDKSISIVKQNRRAERLRYDFELIEETFKVK